MKWNDFDVAVCFVANKGYLQHLSVAIHSFLKSNAGGHELFLFNEDVSGSEIEILNRQISSISVESKLVDMKIDSSILPEFTGYWEKLGKQVFHRLFIPDALPNRFKLALYMDADIVVKRELDFNEYPVFNKTISAVRDSISDYLAPKRGLDKYFNAGIMLIAIEKWKKNDSFQRLLTHQPTKTLFAEQELLNEVFANDWLELPVEYNFPSIRLNKARRMNINPRIIHYLGGLKPWQYWVTGSATYWKVILQTNYRLEAIKAPFTVFKSAFYLFNKE